MKTSKEIAIVAAKTLRQGLDKQLQHLKSFISELPSADGLKL